jgi:hypothetical protein
MRKAYIMTTKNPRINVTFEETTAGLLAQLAHQEHKSVARLVRELTLEALDIREDLYLSKIAETNDKESTITFTHADVWQ